MKQLLLIAVPKDSPSRHDLLEAWKNANGIYTHYCDSIPEAPWEALKMQRGEKREPEMVIADECRLLEECGRLVEGKTEREAILKLCRNLDIPFIE